MRFSFDFKISLGHHKYKITLWLFDLSLEVWFDYVINKLNTLKMVPAAAMFKCANILTQNSRISTVKFLPYAVINRYCFQK